jgi:hypothetical protein
VGMNIKHMGIVADATIPFAMGLNPGAWRGTQGAAPTMAS